MFTYSTKIKIHHIDAAGIMFFGNYFILAHDAYESFLEYLTYNPAYIFEKEMLVPIVHAECDYKQPVLLGDKLTFQLSIEKIGKSSFTLHYDVINQECQPVASLKTIHATVSQKTKKAIPLPPDFRESLQNLSHKEKSDQVF